MTNTQRSYPVYPSIKGALEDLCHLIGVDFKYVTQITAMPGVLDVVVRDEETGLPHMQRYSWPIS